MYHSQMYLLQYRGITFTFVIPQLYQALYSDSTNDLPMRLPVSDGATAAAVLMALPLCCWDCCCVGGTAAAVLMGLLLLLM